ncbi:hypothetical protein C8R45DRAFT_1204563 [Mycena sanguinolenta]|nr:hypothetical protein C8R45DRAFT_1204563 [Mycena sanguinolenta]
MDFSPALLSCFIMAQDAYAPEVHERKARLAEVVFDETHDHAHDGLNPIYTHAVAPDLDCRPVSPVVSECSESSHTTDDTTASRTIGFGRKRHSVISTVRRDDLAQSKIVGFGWTQRPHRHSVSGAPTPSFAPDRKQDNRRSLPVIPRVGPFLVDPSEHKAPIAQRRMTLPVLNETRAEPPILPPPTSRKVSRAGRQPLKPLLLPQQVQTRAPLPPGRVKLCLISVASFPLKFLISRFAAARRMRLKRLNLGHPAGDETREMKNLLRRLRKLYRRLRGL